MQGFFLEKTRQGKTIDTVDNTEKNKEGNTSYSIQQIRENFLVNILPALHYLFQNDNFIDLGSQNIEICVFKLIL